MSKHLCSGYVSNVEVREGVELEEGTSEEQKEEDHRVLGLRGPSQTAPPERLVSAWRNLSPWTEAPGRLQAMGLQRVRYG